MFEIEVQQLNKHPSRWSYSGDKLQYLEKTHGLTCWPHTIADTNPRDRTHAHIWGRDQIIKSQSQPNSLYMYVYESYIAKGHVLLMLAFNCKLVSPFQKRGYNCVVDILGVL